MKELSLLKVDPILVIHHDKMLLAEDLDQEVDRQLEMIKEIEVQDKPEDIAMILVVDKVLGMV